MVAVGPDILFAASLGDEGAIGFDTVNSATSCDTSTVRRLPIDSDAIIAHLEVPELNARYPGVHDDRLFKQTCHHINDTVAKYGILEEDFHNFDEPGSDRYRRPTLAQPGDREWVSVIQSINSRGEAIPPFIIVAGQYHLSNWYEDSALPMDWVISTTRNGWTTNEKGVEWIQHFEKHTKPRTQGAYRLLIMDGHESHHSTEFELFCKEHQIITLCMPSHSSHILQPLDVG
ncbi:hypothetical protein H634G_11152 [Metarhizium anisopliae BRIP 53293]|uniref:DDE-1 domain-containing protein n=1 Tax=Metarhizium anisopliae BRIP 53293 TaxID=1291518 RepID=A0A0D9NLW3_METAN|nr:hypothetical protein H634G_11152 [Metarhizium anisopliae BRIP 53293]